MNKILQIFLIVCLLFFFCLILHFVARKKLNLKYSLVWLFALITMLVVTIFPQIIDIVSYLIGIAAPVNTVFLFCGMFMVLILITLTFIVSHMNKRIYRMSQHIALLEKRIREIENLGAERVK